MAVLRRGMLPIAYEPLIGSPSRNLRIVGLNIVRQFGIEEAERLLLRIVSGDEDLNWCAKRSIRSARCAVR